MCNRATRWMSCTHSPQHIVRSSRSGSRRLGLHPTRSSHLHCSRYRSASCSPRTAPRRCCRRRSSSYKCPQSSHSDMPRRRPTRSSRCHRSRCMSAWWLHSCTAWCQPSKRSDSQRKRCRSTHPDRLYQRPTRSIHLCCNRRSPAASYCPCSVSVRRCTRCCHTFGRHSQHQPRAH